jgi:hypothetical protein
MERQVSWNVRRHRLEAKLTVDVAENWADVEEVLNLSMIKKYQAII